MCITIFLLIGDILKAIQHASVGAVVGGFDSIGRPLCTRPPMPEYSEGLRVRMTPRWREMDSNFQFRAK